MSDNTQQEYGGLPVVDTRYPPKQCTKCGSWFQPSKFTWNYAKRCEECRKPKGNTPTPGAKTKEVPCSECNTMITVGVFAANTQYCDECRDKKGITKKGKPKPEPKINYDDLSPTETINRFAESVTAIKNTVQSGNGSSAKFYAALSQLDVERNIFTGAEISERENMVKEDIYLYLLPKGFLVSKNILYKRYQNMEYVALIFYRDKLHHITWKFEKPDREQSKTILTKDNYNQLSHQIKNDIGLVVTLTGVLKDESPLTDEYLKHIKETSYESHRKYGDMKM